MAFNNFPVSYQPIGYQPIAYPQYQQQQNNQQAVNNQATQQVQNGGFVRVQNEAEARNYLVAQGTSVTFRDESAPYIYTKTMGFSQLDRPTFDKYRLVKEDTEPQKEVLSVEADNTALDELKADIEDMRGEIEALKKKLAPKRKPKEEDEDE